MKALFVTREDIIKKTPLSGNIDPDKLLQYVELAQDMHIQAQLGTDLYEKIQADIIADTLADPYLTLVRTYIRPMLIHYAASEFLHYASYKIENGGVFKASPDTESSVDFIEVSRLIDKERDNAQFYEQRFNDYICNNSTSFPEYHTNSNGDMSPEGETNQTNWVL